MHLNSFEAGVDVPEAVMDKKHRSHRKSHSGEGKAYVRAGLKPKLSVHMDLAELEENTSASDHEIIHEELPVCSKAVAALTLDVETEQWPSLREAANGWDFCSELSEASEVSASTVTTSSWVSVGSPTKSYAAKLLAGYGTADQKPQQLPTLKKSSLAPTEEATLVKAVFKELTPEEVEVEQQIGDMRQKGWQKTHKTSQSVAARRKVAYQSARRAEQRNQCKAVLCED